MHFYVRLAALWALLLLLLFSSHAITAVTPSKAAVVCCLSNNTVPSPRAAPVDGKPGYFSLAGISGVFAMHAACLPDGTVILLDKVENITMATLPSGQYAYSAIYDPIKNVFSAVSVKTNAFCSGGVVGPGGVIMSIGGNGPLPDVDPTVGDGFKSIRTFTRAEKDMAWTEQKQPLSTPRWYPSAIIRPSGDILVCSGSLNGLDYTNTANNNPTCELLDSNGLPKLPSILVEILMMAQPYHMYPMLFIMPHNGEVLIFAGKRGQILDPMTNMTIQRLPELDGLYRTYPNAGSGTMLMLSSKNNYTATIIICGGGAYQDINSPTDHTCGSIVPTSKDPQWMMEAMPEGRTMLDLLNLPDGRLLIINGAGRGAQGFLLGADPVLYALYYDPEKAVDFRFTKTGLSRIARMNHSVVLLLNDGRVMLAGFNPNEMPVFKPDAGHPYASELRVEYYYPNYMLDTNLRPTNVLPATGIFRAYSVNIFVSFRAPPRGRVLLVTLTAKHYVTHGTHNGQRSIELDATGFRPGEMPQGIYIKTPPNSFVAPPGQYMLCVFVDGQINDWCPDITIPSAT